MATIETDILIVGGGIAGSALACALRHAGYRIVLVECRTKPLDTARGDHLQPYTVQLLDRWGVLQTFFARGAGKRNGAEYRTPSGEVLLSCSYDELPLKHPYYLVFHHELIASLFTELAAENPNFLLLQPVTARQFQVGDEGIRALEVTLPDETTATIKAHLVVGADGTNSVVRSAVGIASDEYVYDHPFVTLFGPKPEPNPRRYIIMYVGLKGIVVVIPRMGHQVKVGLPIRSEDIPFWKRSTSEQRAQVLAERAEILRGFESELAGFYPIRMVNAHQHYWENVVLIGDAAHSVHPARGQGMNIAIRGIQSLIECLPPPSEMSHSEKLKLALQHYQDRQRPLTDEIIAKNHGAALDMDTTTEESLMRRIQQFRQVHQNPELRKQYLLETSGYPFGLPGQ